jgi:predicted exporter
MKRRFWIWTVAMLALAALFLVDVRPRLHVETDLLALLPASEHDADASAALRVYSDGVARKALFLVGAPDLAGARAAAESFVQRLRDSNAFAQVHLQIDAAGADIVGVYAPHRDGLLSARVREQLESGNGERLYADALRAIYGPAAAPRPLPVVQDPLNLLGDFLGGALLPIGAARLQDGVLVVAGEHRQYVLVNVELRGSPFAGATQDQVMPVLDDALAQARSTPGVDVLCSGLLLHAAQATSSAQREIGTVGTLSMLGVVLMVLLTFRSIRPLWLAMLVLASGTLAAISACHYLFGQIHLITLVFGSGLIGVGIDYSNHFLADQFHHPQGWTPQRAMRHIGPGIAMGMSCAVLGYAALALAPLPGLRQMAIFSGVGLLVCCGSVLCWYPRLARAARRTDPPLLLRASLRIDALVGRVAGTRTSRVLLIAMLLIGALGLWRLHFADDVRLLQSSTPELLNQERDVRALLRDVPDSRVFLVRGDSADTVLAAEEQLRVSLDALVARGALASYLSLSRELPSLQRQQRDRQLLATQVYSDNGLAPQLLAQLGFAPDVIATQQQRFASSADAAPLQIESWLQTPIAQPFRSLWLGRIGDGYASVIAPVGVHDAAAVAALSAPGVRYIDKVADISDLLGRYRERAALLIAGAYTLIGLLMAWRYGVLAALRLLAVPVGAALLTLSLFGLAGVGASLFNLLALFLVLGLGVDYAVFLRESGEARGATLLALSLSTLGTVLSYGLLAFSATPFIRSLGLTLLIGITLTYLFALLSQRPAPSNL